MPYGFRTSHGALVDLGEKYATPDPEDRKGNKFYKGIAYVQSQVFRRGWPGVWLQMVKDKDTGMETFALLCSRKDKETIEKVKVILDGQEPESFRTVTKSWRTRKIVRLH
jgi:hypothetical protein